MRFVPYEHVIIRTALAQQEVIQKLEDVIQPRPPRWQRWTPEFSHKPYEGHIGDRSFVAWRILHGQNSFLPEIRGAIKPELGGCQIEVTMIPQPLVLLLLAVWLGFVGLGVPVMAISMLKAGQLRPEALLLAAMLILGYGVALVGFKSESVRAKAFFRELLKAREFEELGFGSPTEREG
jgi:hypothetical protein